MDNKAKAFGVLIVIAVIAVAFLNFTPDISTASISGALDDVTGGSDVLSINTGGTSTGTASASYENGVYTLTATFQGLPDPQNEEFYEGWIVRRGIDFDVISTGVLEKQGDTYVNEYTSSRNLLDHDFYVLTIEPNDGDPAPADHVLEGTLN